MTEEQSPYGEAIEKAYYEKDFKHLVPEDVQEEEELLSDFLNGQYLNKDIHRVIIRVDGKRLSAWEWSTQNNTITINIQS